MGFCTLSEPTGDTTFHTYCIWCDNMATHKYFICTIYVKLEVIASSCVNALRINPSPWQLLVFGTDVQFSATSGVSGTAWLVNIHQLWIRLLLHECSTAVLMCCVKWPSGHVHTGLYHVTLHSQSPLQYCALCGSGAVRFASANRIYPPSSLRMTAG